MNKPRDALQPALLDRLQDNEPHVLQEPPEHRVINKSRLRSLVLRDLENLLNSSQILSSSQLEGQSQLRASVLAYGMPPLAGKIASMVDVREFERTVADLIKRFEPRIDSASLKVKADSQQVLMDSHNVIGLHISGLLWAQPYPLELLLRSQIDLETGRVSLMPASGFDMRLE